MKTLKKYLLCGFLVVGCALFVHAQQKIWTITGNGSRRNTDEFEIQTQTVGTAADFVPGTDNANSLGTSSLRWDDIQGVDATLDGDVTIGDAATDTLTINSMMTIAVSTEPNNGVTPTAVGQLIWNSTSSELCASTAAVANSWVRVSISSGTLEACLN